MKTRPKGKAPSVSRIRDASEVGRTYFSRGALHFFDRRLSDFRVTWNKVWGAWETRAALYSPAGKCGESVRLWSAETLAPIEYPRDPTENYREQIRIALRLTPSDDASGDFENDAVRLAELVLALHDWRGNGGFEPDYFK